MAEEDGSKQPPSISRAHSFLSRTKATAGFKREGRYPDDRRITTRMHLVSVLKDYDKLFLEHNELKKQYEACKRQLELAQEKPMAEKQGPPAHPFGFGKPYYMIERRKLYGANTFWGLAPEKGAIPLIRWTLSRESGTRFETCEAAEYALRGLVPAVIEDLGISVTEHLDISSPAEETPKEPETVTRYLVERVNERGEDPRWLVRLFGTDGWTSKQRLATRFDDRETAQTAVSLHGARRLNNDDIYVISVYGSAALKKSLPVINTCGECKHSGIRTPASVNGFCASKYTPPGLYVAWDLPPPDVCRPEYREERK